jgi:AAA+ ATPase superfamily predicted ATPase
MYSSGTTNQSIGLTALAKLIIFGRNDETVFSEAEKQIVDGEWNKQKNKKWEEFTQLVRSKSKKSLTTFKKPFGLIKELSTKKPSLNPVEKSS